MKKKLYICTFLYLKETDFFQIGKVERRTGLPRRIEKGPSQPSSSASSSAMQG